jgi:hypothetical protein
MALFGDIQGQVGAHDAKPDQPDFGFLHSVLPSECPADRSARGGDV